MNACKSDVKQVWVLLFLQALATSSARNLFTATAASASSEQETSPESSLTYQFSMALHMLVLHRTVGLYKARIDYAPVLLFNVQQTGLEPSRPGCRPNSSSVVGRAPSAVDQMDDQNPTKPARLYFEAFRELRGGCSVGLSCGALPEQSGSGTSSGSILLLSATSVERLACAFRPVIDMCIL